MPPPAAPGTDPGPCSNDPRWRKTRVHIQAIGDPPGRYGVAGTFILVFRGPVTVIQSGRTTEFSTVTNPGGSGDVARRGRGGGGGPRGGKSYTATAGEDGAFAIKAPPGTCEVAPAEGEWEPASRSVALTERKDVDVVNDSSGEDYWELSGLERLARDITAFYEGESRWRASAAGIPFP